MPLWDGGQIFSEGHVPFTLMIVRSHASEILQNTSVIYSLFSSWGLSNDTNTILLAMHLVDRYQASWMVL